MIAPLAWRVDGPDDAQPLVLLNSVGTTTEMWTPCLAPLGEQFRVIRIDTRGHGASPAAPAGSGAGVAGLAAEVVATLDEIGVDRCHLAGLSLGGMVGMWLAAHRPERIQRLALLATSARLGPAEFWTRRASAVRNGGMSSIAESVVARWITPELAERDPQLLAELRAMVESVDAESYAQCCAAIAEMDQRADLARIAAPTLVIGASDDVATPPEHQREIADRIPGARLAIVDDAAHLLTYEQPARVAALLLEHFRGAGTTAAGYDVRRAVLGDRYVDAALANRTELTADFQEFLTRYAWGEVWTRPELSRRDRSIATLAALVTIGAEHELAAHIAGARRNGLTDREIIEALHHLAIYAGMPRANRAVAIARDVLSEGTQP
jgi:3-oxoadipate enol-lactonase/4-carboxymuconolactone decarboxylase